MKEKRKKEVGGKEEGLGSSLDKEGPPRVSRELKRGGLSIFTKEHGGGSFGKGGRGLLSRTGQRRRRLMERGKEGSEPPREEN